MKVFQTILDEFIDFKNEENRKNRYEGNEKYFGASSADSCHRKQFYKYNQYPETKQTPKESYRRMRLGTIWHDEMELAIKYFLNNSNDHAIKAIHTEQEHKLEELNVRGFSDAVVEMESGEIYVIDFKTSGDWAYRQVFGARVGDLNNTKHSYKLQLATYGMAVEKEYGRIDGMFLVYFNITNGEIGSAKVGTKYFKEAKEYWINMQSDINSGLPEVTKPIAISKSLPRHIKGTKYDWECGYCNWFDQCKMDGDEKGIIQL
jgi:hypothetical protein